MPDYYFFQPYVPVAERRARAGVELRRLLRPHGRRPAPIIVEGRAIARTFWGRAWCANLERYSDFASRLPRGRTYARNRSVLDLEIRPGAVRAYVAGYDLYTVEVSIRPLAARRWRAVVSACGSRIASAVALLRGELSDDVLAALTHAKQGLFPEPREILMRCSCPDVATMCKHVAATLYGVGARLDEQPELFFTLRRVDQADLIGGIAPTKVGGVGKKTRGKVIVSTKKLEAIFGIELDEVPPAPAGRPRGRRRAGR